MKTSPLIHRLAVPDPAYPGSNDAATPFQCDPVFHISDNPRLQLQVNGWSDRALEYLEHAVSSTRHDLRSHVQRIYLHIEREDNEAIYGALADLFIVLKAQGRPLRERMLAAARPRLDVEHYRFLLAHLEEGVSEVEAIPPCRACLLNKGIRGTPRLVEKQEARPASQHDPLQEARDHLEYGQIEEAREVLETALLVQPHRRELHDDLLEIYRRTNAAERFRAMQRRLSNRHNPAADAWHELAVIFEGDRDS